jgi:phosphoglycerate dehydrogenase-like enzyme
MKVAVLDDYQQVAFSYADWSLLPSWVTVEFFSNHISDDDLVNNMKDFDAIVGMRERTPFPKTVIEKLPKLKLLITTGWRNASFDLEAATVNGITVCGTETGGEGTTELTWGLIIGLIRHIGIEQESSKKGFWGTTVGGDLKGQTLGILGLGHIGSLVAKVGIAFGMEVIAWSQNLTHDIAEQCGAKLVEKKVLFEKSDILTVHLKLSERTRGIIGKKEIQLMKPTSYLVNTSRGPIVDEKSLLDGLRNRVIAGAALDTFNVEPLPIDHELLKLSNVLLTPHLGYTTQESYRAFFSGVVEDLSTFIQNAPVRVLNPEVLKSKSLRGLNRKN